MAFPTTPPPNEDAESPAINCLEKRDTGGGFGQRQKEGVGA